MTDRGRPRQKGRRVNLIFFQREKLIFASEDLLLYVCMHTGPKKVIILGQQKDYECKKARGLKDLNLFQKHSSKLCHSLEPLKP
jgi:hypothetical protein